MNENQISISKKWLKPLLPFGPSSGAVASTGAVPSVAGPPSWSVLLDHLLRLFSSPARVVSNVNHLQKLVRYETPEPGTIKEFTILKHANMKSE